MKIKNILRNESLVRAALVVTLLIALVAAPMAIVQTVKLSNISEENKTLLQENASMKQHNTQLESDIQEMGTQLESLEAELSETIRISESRENANNHLRERVEELTEENKELWQEHLFFSNSAVILPNDGTWVFHKYGCSRLDSYSSYWIYNSEAAFSKGYDPCVYCMTSGYYIGNMSSGVYHRPTCGTLPAMWNRTYFSTKEEAETSGYKSCGNCSP